MNVIESSISVRNPLLLLLLAAASIYCLGQDVSINEPSSPDKTHVQNERLTVYSPDKKFFVLATKDGKLRYCRATDGTAVRTFYHCVPKAVVFSPDGNLLASIGGSKGNSRASQTQKRGGGKVIFSLDEEEAEERYKFEPADNTTPDVLFERRWAVDRPRSSDGSSAQ